MSETDPSDSARGPLDFLKNISGPATAVASATGFFLCFVYCLQIRYFPAADFASLSGGFVAVALLAFLLLVIIMLPAVAALMLLSVEKLQELSNALKWTPTFVALGFAFFATIGQMSFAIVLCLRLFARIHTSTMIIATLAIVVVLWVAWLALRPVAQGILFLGQFATSVIESLSPKASASQKPHSQGTLFRGSLEIVFVGGILLTFALIAFVQAANQNIQFPIQARPIQVGIRGLCFSLSPFVFSGNYLAAQWFVGAQRYSRRLSAFSCVVYGVGMMILISFGLPGKFLATLGLGDLYNCTLVIQQDAANTFVAAGYNPKPGASPQSAEVPGVHVLLAIGGSVVIAQNNAVLTFTRRSIQATDRGEAVIILFPTLVDNVHPGEPSRAIHPEGQNYLNCVVNSPI